MTTAIIIVGKVARRNERKKNLWKVEEHEIIELREQ